jgi:hypothetical protein
MSVNLIRRAKVGPIEDLPDSVLSELTATSCIVEPISATKRNGNKELVLTFINNFGFIGRSVFVIIQIMPLMPKRIPLSI